MKSRKIINNTWKNSELDKKGPSNTKSYMKNSELSKKGRQNDKSFMN